MLGIGRVVSGITKRPKTFIGGAAVAGMAAANPLEEPSRLAQEELLGTPNAINQMLRGEISANFSDTSYREDVLGRLRNPSQGRSIGSSASGTPGEIVFGMYNLRNR